MPIAALVLFMLLAVAFDARPPVWGDDDGPGVELLRDVSQGDGSLRTFEAGRKLGAGVAKAPPRRARVPSMRRVEVPKAATPEAREPVAEAEDDLALKVGAAPLDAEFRGGRGESDQTDSAAGRMDAAIGFRLLGGRAWTLRAQIRHELLETGTQASDKRRSEVAVALQRRF